MKKILFITLYSVFGLLQAQKVNGELLNALTGEMVPYANIFCKSQATIGSNTDAQGKFNFRVPEKYSGKEFVFSAVGYHDTIIALNSEMRNLKIELKPVVYELSETTVTANVTYEKIQYGSAEYPIQMNKKGQTTGEYLEKKTPFGIMVKSKSRAVLRKFSYFVADEGKLGSTFVMKIVGFDSNRKIKTELMNKFTDGHSYDITHKPIVFTAEKRGWNTIEMPKEEDWIILPKGTFLCVIYQIDKGNDLVWENEGKNYNFYGSVIANYKLHYSSTKLTYCYVSYGNPYPHFSYFLTSPSPAVIFECDKLK